MHRRRGQGTAELALMIPFLFALIFLCIEFALYFGAIHWDDYAAFAMARSVQVGGDARSVGHMLLDGHVTRTATTTPGSDRATVHQPWTVDTPGASQLLGSMDFDVTMVLGPDERLYEGRVNRLYRDNDLGGPHDARAWP
ncbi:MAG: pilus assembly protein [Deltaproteobacteria bacterium]|nr:pilus assembly protein [Deltaproteobacteria bacterium]